MIPESFIEELKYRSDIESIVAPFTKLKRSGKNLSGLCPFHSEKSPSFVVYPENGSFYCFGCGAGGDVVTFVRMAEHLEYMEALRFLAQRSGMNMPEDVQNDVAAKQKIRLLELNREAARFFYKSLNSPIGQAALSYLRNRGLTDATIKRFGIGFAPDSWDSLKNHLLQKGFTEAEMSAAAVTRISDKARSYDIFRNRVMFPIIDLRGNVIGFGGRILGEGQPKYLNSADTIVFKKSRGLFAMNIAKSSKEGSLILCEGYLDAISVHQAGFDNAVATLGTALTSEQSRLIANYTSLAIIAYDSDEAGQKATARATPLLTQAGVKVKVISMKGAKDPDEYIKKFGTLKFKELIMGSANATEYSIETLKKKYNLDLNDDKVMFIKEVCALLAGLENMVECDVYSSSVASELNVSKEAISASIKAIRAKAQRQQQKKFEQSLKPYTQQNPIAQREKDPQIISNPNYAAAEEKLIAILLKNPDYYKQVAQLITLEDMVTDSNREILQVILNRLSQSLGVDIIYLGSALSIPQINRVSHIINSNAHLNFTLQDAESWILKIKEKKSLKTKEQIGQLQTEEWADELRKQANAKKANKN